MFTISGTCSDLPPLMNGGISYEAGLTDSRPINSIATFICVTGYTLTGGSSTRTCESDGRWSGLAPTCQRKCMEWTLHCLFVECIVSHTANCRDLPSLTNGMIMYRAGSPGNRPFLSHAVHSCNTGYTLIGGTFIVGTTRFCVGGGWSGSPPTCQGEWNWICTVICWMWCSLCQELVLIYHL